VVRCITVFNSNQPAEATVHLIHSPSLCTIYQEVLGSPALTSPALDTRSYLIHFVFNAGESVYCANDSGTDMTVSGFLLTLP
jgi:hypothetical protein